MVDITWAKKIKNKVKAGEGAPCSQEELKSMLGNPDRRLVSGYLQCMVDLGKISVKSMGKTKAYFFKGGKS